MIHEEILIVRVSLVDAHPDLAAAEEGVLVASDGLRPGSRVLLGGEWSDGDPVS